MILHCIGLYRNVNFITVHWCDPIGPLMLTLHLALQDVLRWCVLAPHLPSCHLALVLSVCPMQDGQVD